MMETGKQVDTGTRDATTQQVWERLFAGALDPPITRIVVTHFHPNHSGMAGRIAERFGIAVYTKRDRVSHEQKSIPHNQL